MLQLRDILDYIEENYKEEYEQTGYFAAIDMASLLTYAVSGKKKGKIFLVAVNNCLG